MAPVLAAHPVRAEEPIVAICRFQKSIPSPHYASHDTQMAPGRLAFAQERQHDCHRCGQPYLQSHYFHGENAAEC